MITIQIGEDIRPLEDAHESWITQQVNKPRGDQLPICVRLTIRTSGIDMILATPDCGGGGGGGRKPRPVESDLFQLWDKHKLNSDEFTGGNLLAFIKEMDRHL